MTQDSKDYAYLLNIATRREFAVGDYVALIDDRFNINDPLTMGSKKEVLGKVSDLRVGEVTEVLNDQCVNVRFGSQTSIGTYDQKCLGYVSVTLKEGGFEGGMLGAPAEQKVGYIKSWSNWGLGDAVLIKLKETAPANNYKVSDLKFHITTVPPLYGSRVDASQMKGGAKRKTIRRPRTKSFFTRFFRRV